MARGYENFKDIPLEEGFNFLHVKLRKGVSLMYEDIKIWIDFKRLKVFKKSLKCVYCGLEGNIFRIQKSGNLGWHLNLWRIDKKIKRLFTLDHIIPKSLSHDNRISNLQTCCEKCNTKKGSVYINLN